MNAAYNIIAIATDRVLHKIKKKGENMIKSRSKGARSLHRLHVRHPMKVSGNLIIRKQSYLGRTFQDGPVNLVHLRSHSPY